MQPGSHPPRGDSAGKLKEQDILVIAISPTQVRFVTHLDISPEMVERAVGVIQGL